MHFFLGNMKNIFTTAERIDIGMLKERMKEAIKVAQHVGRFIKENREQVGEVRMKSSNTDLVSDMDIHAQKHIIDGLKNHFPTDSFWGEESEEALEENAHQLWVIDPIDGTTNYLYHLPFCAISIAYYLSGSPVIGVLHAPFLGEDFYAMRDGGAFRNGKQLFISQTHRLSEALIGTGFPYSLELREKEKKRYNHLLPACLDFRCLGSAALELAYLAAGRLDAFFEPELHFYDVAAALVLVEEAGGVYSQIDGAPWDITSNTLIASNPVLHPQLVNILQKRNRKNEE